MVLIKLSRLIPVLAQRGSMRYKSKYKIFNKSLLSNGIYKY